MSTDTIAVPGEGTRFRPSTLMARVSEVLQRSGPLPLRGIQDRVTGKAEYIRKAVAALVDEGYVKIAKGAHNANLHESVRPYP